MARKQQLGSVIKKVFHVIISISSEMHDITTDWQIFGGVFQPTDIRQGVLGNCYLLAALASLAVHRNGQYIKDIFITQVKNKFNINLSCILFKG